MFLARPPARLLTLLSYTNSSSPHKYRRISVSLWCLLIKQIDSLYPRQILCLSVSYTKRMIYPFAYNTVRLRWPRGSSVSKFHHHLCTDLCVIICCWEKKRERRHGLGRAGPGDAHRRVWWIDDAPTGRYSSSAPLVRPLRTSGVRPAKYWPWINTEKWSASSYHRMMTSFFLFISRAEPMMTTQSIKKLIT